MQVAEIRHTLQHMLVVLQNIGYLPYNPTKDDIDELKQVDDLVEDIQAILNHIDAEERESN